MIIAREIRLTMKTTPKKIAARIHSRVANPTTKPVKTPKTADRPISSTGRV